MPVLSIALMGFLAFSGGPAVAPDAPSLAMGGEQALTADSLALAQEDIFTRAAGDETYVVKLTSYNAVPEQTDSNPHETASGLISNSEVIAARSVDLAGALPWGTVIAIERDAEDTPNCRYGAVEHLIGYRVVGDSMHSRKRAQIDVQLDQNDTVVVDGKEVNPSLALGLCEGVTIRVIGQIEDLQDIPDTQEELRKMVEGDHLALRK